MSQVVKILSKKTKVLFRKIGNNAHFVESVKTLLLRVFGMLSLFGFTFFITNNYPIEVVGQYDFVRTYLLVVGCICMMGTDQSILYFAGMLKVQNNLWHIKKVYRKMVILLFLCGIVLFLLFVTLGEKQILLLFDDKTVYPLLLKSNFIVFFYALTLFNTEVLRALDYIYLSELFRNTFKYMTVILASIFLSLFHREQLLVDFFLFGFLLLSIVTSIIVVLKLNKINKINNVNLSTEKVTSYASIFIKSYPIAISSCAIFLLSSFDIFFLKTYWGNDMVAKYSIGVKIMTIIAMIIQMINVNSSTKIAYFYSQQNHLELQNTCKNAARTIAFFSIPIVTLIYIFSSFIVNLFGANYAESKNAMIILVLCQGLGALCGVSAIYLNMTERQKIFQIILIFAVVLNYILNFVLTPLYGMIGSAYAFAITLILWNLIVLIYVYNTDKIKLYLH